MKWTICCSLVGCTIVSFGVVGSTNPAMPQELSPASRDAVRFAQVPPEKRDAGESGLTEEEKARRKKQQEERAKAKAGQDEQKQREERAKAKAAEDAAKAKAAQDAAKAKAAQDA